MYFENNELNLAHRTLRAKNVHFHANEYKNCYLYHRLNALADLIADQQLSNSEAAEILRQKAVNSQQY